MKRLENGDFLVLAANAAEAVEVVRDRVSLDRASAISAVHDACIDGGLWLVCPHWNERAAGWDDNVLADPGWVSDVTPSGWNVEIETKLNLLIIRSGRSLCFIEAMPSNLLFRGQLRHSFSQLGVTIK